MSSVNPLKFTTEYCNTYKIKYMVFKVISTGFSSSLFKTKGYLVNLQTLVIYKRTKTRRYSLFQGSKRDSKKCPQGCCSLDDAVLQYFLPMDHIPIKTPNPNCRLFLKIYLSKDPATGVYQSEAPSPPMTPSRPPVIHCMNTYIPLYLFTQGRGRGEGEPVRRLEGRQFTRGVENTNMTDCVSPVYKLYCT